MTHVLFKRAIRDLKANLARYLALGILIIFSIYIVISLVGAASSTIDQTAYYDQKLHCEDGEFSVFVPLKEGEKKKIAEKKVGLEEMFFLDLTMKDQSTLRLFKQREQIDLLSLKEGRLAESASEVVLERRYAEVNNIHAGEKILLGGKAFTVVGTGAVPDYNAVLKNLGDSTVDSKSFGLAFVIPDAYEQIREAGVSDKSEEYYYAYRLCSGYSDEDLKALLKKFQFSADAVKDAYFKEYWDRTAGNKDLLTGILGMVMPNSKSMVEKMFGDSTANLKMFLKAEDNVRIDAAADDVEINKTSGVFVGILLVILCSYVISVFVVHTIDQESAVIGALYSMGVKRKELLIHYIILPVIITFVSGALGLLLSFTGIGIDMQMQDNYNYFSMPVMKTEVTPFMVVYALVMPPVTAAIVNTLIIRKRLLRTPLSLLRNEQKLSKVRNVHLGHMAFLKLFKLRQMLRETRTGLAVVFGMFLSLLVAMLAVNIFIYCDKVRVRSVEETKFEYMYTYKYPSEKPPAGGYEALAETMKKDFGEYTFDVTVLGITKDNPFFGIKKFPKNKNEIIAGSGFASKYQLRKGDEFILKSEDGDMSYAFQVAGTVDYSGGFFIFMDIDQCRELFGTADDYFNAVFSDKKLDIDGGRLYNTMTKKDVEKSADIFINQMMATIIMIGTASAVIFIVVMYLMMKMMIDKSSFHIALVKIFGFRDREVRKMYLDGNFYIIAVGALLSIPLCKLILNYVYPNYLVANIAISYDNSFPWYIYAGIYAVILVLYFVISHLLTGRIRKMVPAEVLKNRE